jgi:hypothetical protein
MLAFFFSQIRCFYASYSSYSFSQGESNRYVGHSDGIGLPTKTLAVFFDLMETLWDLNEVTTTLRQKPGGVGRVSTRDVLTRGHPQHT